MQGPAVNTERYRQPLGALALVLALIGAQLVACGGSSSPTAPKCSDASGTYTAIVANSCGGTGRGIVVLAQSGCSFTALLPGASTLQGTVSGNTFTFSGVFASPCAGTFSGSGTVTAGAVNGTFTGTSQGGPGCCPAGPVSGSFTLTR